MDRGNQTRGTLFTFLRAALIHRALLTAALTSPGNVWLYLFVQHKTNESSHHRGLHRSTHFRKRSDFLLLGITYYLAQRPFSQFAIVFPNLS